ncbi:MAG: hypothetical protein R3B09_13785 [Nannocystaceae bacterium]
MHHAHAILLLALLTPLAAACPLKPEIIGETFTTADEGATESDTDADTDAATTTSASATTEGSASDSSTSSAPGLDYGEPCEFEGLGPTIEVTAMSPQPACAGGICLLVHDAILPCEDDAVCIDDPDHGACGADDLCTLAPEYVAEHARCTQTCDDVSECPPIPGCAEVVCGPIALLGELCCQKVCACLDGTSSGDMASREAQCADPGACS